MRKEKSDHLLHLQVHSVGQSSELRITNRKRVKHKKLNSLAVNNARGLIGFHAGILEFIHPATGKCMHFETSVPAVLKKLFE
jgi:hypothetical protein